MAEFVKFGAAFDYSNGQHAFGSFVGATESPNPDSDQYIYLTPGGIRVTFQGRDFTADEASQTTGTVTRIDIGLGSQLARVTDLSLSLPTLIAKAGSADFWPTVLAGNDNIQPNGSTSGLFNGYDGNDYIVSTVSSDTVDGGSGNDTLIASQGSDTYDGGAGGGDELHFDGSAFDYDITQQGSSFTIIDSFPNRDGTNIAENIEQFIFSDRILVVEPPDFSALDAPSNLQQIDHANYQATVNALVTGYPTVEEIPEEDLFNDFNDVYAPGLPPGRDVEDSYLFELGRFREVTDTISQITTGIGALDRVKIDISKNPRLLDFNTFNPNAKTTLVGAANLIGKVVDRTVAIADGLNEWQRSGNALNGATVAVRELAISFASGTVGAVGGRFLGVGASRVVTGLAGVGLMSVGAGPIVVGATVIIGGIAIDAGVDAAIDRFGPKLFPKLYPDQAQAQPPMQQLFAQMPAPQAIDPPSLSKPAWVYDADSEQMVVSLKDTNPDLYYAVADRLLITTDRAPVGVLITGNQLLTPHDTLSGTNADDTIRGYSGNDLLIGHGGNDQIFGHDGADTLVGGSGRDLLSGGAGNDSLEGEAGNDTLNGGAGRDTMKGGTGNDLFYVDNAGDKALGGSGTDKVNASINYSLAGDVENLTLTGTANLRGTGNDLANTIIGNAGRNVLFGGGGNDSLVGSGGNDTVNGGAGRDTVKGGAGNDLLIVNHAGDRAYGGGGVDRVNASVSHTLAGDAENLTLIGTANINGTGNALANTIIGNAGRNVLSGKGGNDRLSGDAGADKLFGGAHNDTLSGGNGSDTLSGDAGRDQLFGGGHGDRLFGGAADDTLKGDSGNDFFVGGSGNDRIVGGAGSSDTAAYNGGIGRYQITEISGGRIKVVDSKGTFGTDILSGVERLKFGDMIYKVANAVSAKTAPKDADDIDPIGTDHGRGRPDDLWIRSLFEGTGESTDGAPRAPCHDLLVSLFGGGPTPFDDLLA